MIEEKDVSIGEYIRFALNIIVNLRKKGKTKEEVIKFLESTSDTPSLKELDVKEGQMVKQGELLGKSGATGLATGPHLHWEIRLNMAAVRPEFFMQDFAHQNNNN